MTSDHIGLSVGMICSMIIALFIIHELSYDKFNEKKDRIYRVILSGKLGGQEVKVTYTASPIGPTMKNEFPEVEDFLRMNNWDETIIRYGERSFTEKHFIEVDSSFFNFFSIPLARGNASDVLNEPHTMVLTRSAAKRIFGEEDPINKMLKVGTDTVLYRVTGIMEEIPETAHFPANMISSFMTNPRANDDQWLSNSFSTYVLLHQGASPQTAEARIPDMIVKYVGPILQSFLGLTVEEFFSQGNKYNMSLQPLEKIHLDPTIEQAFKPANDPKYLLIFGSIGIMAGSYPAFYLSSFNPYMVLKGSSVKGHSSGRLRNLLVIIQFAISIILIVGTMIMYRQLQFMQNKELGFNKENVMVINRADAIGSHIKSFKDDLLKIPGVMSVASSTAVPGHNNNNNGYRVQGRPDESFLLQTNWVDHDYLETYGIKLESGRFFDKSFATDKDACIINECAVNHYQFTDPSDVRFIMSVGNSPEETVTKPVIGVVKDFHFESLRTRIGPYIMHFKDEGNNWGYVSIRLSPETGPATFALPLAYLITGNWLQNYEYRIHLQPLDFLAGFIIAIFIAIMTISYRAIRTAQMNPVVSLKYE